MIKQISIEKVHLALGATDLRKYENSLIMRTKTKNIR